MVDIFTLFPLLSFFQSLNQLLLNLYRALLLRKVRAQCLYRLRLVACRLAHTNAPAVLRADVPYNIAGDVTRLLQHFTFACQKPITRKMFAL